MNSRQTIPSVCTLNVLDCGFAARSAVATQTQHGAHSLWVQSFFQDDDYGPSVRLDKILAFRLDSFGQNCANLFHCINDLSLQEESSRNNSKGMRTKKSPFSFLTKYRYLSRNQQHDQEEWCGGFHKTYLSRIVAKFLFHFLHDKFA